MISANAEWGPVRRFFPQAPVAKSPFGEFFSARVGAHAPLFVHGGWGKIDAAASAQYVIDRWAPRLLLNLGTCGGMQGAVERDQIVLAERTVVYDIVELMGDAEEAISDYTTRIDLGWLGSKHPGPVVRSTLVSADRDLAVADIARLRAKYGAVAADWESGAIARVAARNGQKVLILRAVSDLVGSGGGEAYGQPGFFERRSEEIMQGLLRSLPLWLDHCVGRLS
ncbi:5'-methylthioadenosine/S-adenosylhomocysteine nucleosidase family protein [Paludibaculum fermentans]|uniref:Nucleoside phosphorylase domain-containing protein n=1 Tax=Paludibaculum fermentans TaxID=1473598 RepID=A0A7S7NPG0_PALFE|nr:hypothetical protein [Paludibaculum fermentans]QOY87377.1 hypothetical protein IRI77_32215 [Paludibaculum fermentans]